MNNAPHVDGTPPATGPAHGGAALFDPILALLAEQVDDIEHVRVGAQNRHRILTRTEPDADGVMRGFGLTEAEAAPYAAIADEMLRLEVRAVRELERRMRAHPLGPWVKAQVGLGAKQVGRLLAATGDPYWHTAEGRPRGVYELYAYCGYHTVPVDTGTAGGQNTHEARGDAAAGVEAGGGGTGHTVPGAPPAHIRVAPTRRRNQRSNWSAAARKRAYLIAESCIRQQASPYRPTYDAAREKYAGATHDIPCVRCGPRGHPAPAGSPLSNAHQHRRALRAVSKAVLKDLWRESRRLHLAAAGAGGGG